MIVLLNLENKYASMMSRVSDILRANGATRVITCPVAMSRTDLGFRVQQFEVDRVIILHPTTAKNLLISLEKIKSNKEKLNDDDWAGSVLNVAGTPTMLGHSPRFWFSKTYTSFLFTEHCKKLFRYNTRELLSTDKYLYTSVDKGNWRECLSVIETSVLTAIDIETIKHKRMSMVGYSCLLPSGHVTTYVIDIRSLSQIQEFRYEFIRSANASKAPKIFHNGTYDNQYFARYQCPVYNYTLDTEYLFHSIYAELPKSLAAVSAFYLPTAEYWKHTAGSNMPLYNALDCYNTLMACIKMLEDYPAYAVKNYQEKFPLTTPAIWSAMHGMNTDSVHLAKARKADDEERQQMQDELDTMCGFSSDPASLSYGTLNVNSPKQVPALFYNVLGARKIKLGRVIQNGCPTLVLTKLSEQHPLIRRFATLVKAIRKKRKAISTYYDASLYSSGGTDRLLWSYRIDGTKTERLSCKQSNFGESDKHSYGAQVQNVPPYYREACIADEGFILFSRDYSQSEARCVAYLSDDKALIKAFEESDDFYNTCGMLFFGIPANEVPKTLRNKVIKKIIHGSNYRMKGQTFCDNMGTDNLVTAMITLERPQDESVIHFGNYLLSLYHKAYPNVSEWYKSITVMLRTSALYTSVLGYTHRFFDDPYKEPTLNFAVALAPQNLSVTLINRSVVRIFWEVQVPSKGEFKYIAQVHDENIQQCKVGTEDKYGKMVEDIMRQPIKFPTGETMIIPVDGGAANRWSDIH